LDVVLSKKSRNVPVTTWLDKAGINAIYADEIVTRSFGFRQLIRRLERTGWTRLAPSNAEQGWILLYRAPRSSTVQL
jgi:hypothetical protein